VVGLACSACSANVEKKLNSLSGVKSASVNLLARTALVEYDATEISLEKMKSEVNAIGYDLVIESNRSAEAIERRELQLLKQSTLLSWVFAILCMCVSMGWLNLGGKAMNNQVALLLALANFVVCGRGFFVKSWQCGCSCLPDSSVACLAGCEGRKYNKTDRRSGMEIT